MDELEQLNYDTSKPISDEQASQLADQQEQYAEYRNKKRLRDLAIKMQLKPIKTKEMQK